MHKVNYDHKPPKLEAVGNGSYLYRWDIKQISKIDENGDEYISWECYEILSWKKDKKEITRAAINLLRGNADYEAKLINDYNAAIAGILDINFKQPYLNYIAAREALKDDINNYFSSL